MLSLANVWSITRDSCSMRSASCCKVGAALAAVVLCFDSVSELSLPEALLLLSASLLLLLPLAELIVQQLQKETWRDIDPQRKART
jgi:hypothetical protein